MAQGQQIPPGLLGLLEELHFHNGIMMNSMSVTAAAQTTSASSCEDEKGAQSWKVRASMRTLSAANDSTLCSLACRHACHLLPGCPTLVVTFFDYQSCTTRQAAGKLAERLRRVRPLGPCGQGGGSAREAAPECLRARL